VPATAVRRVLNDISDGIRGATRARGHGVFFFRFDRRESGEHRRHSLDGAMCGADHGAYLRVGWGLRFARSTRGAQGWAGESRSLSGGLRGMRGAGRSMDRSREGHRRLSVRPGSICSRLQGPPDQIGPSAAAITGRASINAIAFATRRASEICCKETVTRRWGCVRRPNSK